MIYLQMGILILEIGLCILLNNLLKNKSNKKRLFLRKSHTSKWRARFVSSRPVTFQHPLHLSESFGIPIHSVFIDGVFIVCFIYKYFRISSMIYVPIIQ